MGKRKSTNPSTYLPYTPKIGVYKKDENFFDVKDTVFYRGLRFANEVEYDKLFEVVNYTKFIFNGSDVGEYVWEHLSTDVVFIPYNKIESLTWYLEYDYSMSLFKLHIQDIEFVQNVSVNIRSSSEIALFKWLAKHSAFIPVLVIEPEYTKMFLSGNDPNYQTFTFTYRVWLNNSTITDSLKNTIKYKMRSSLANYDETLTIIFNKEDKDPVLFDTNDAAYMAEASIIDNQYYSYSEFKKIESESDPVFRRFYKNNIDDSEFKNIYRQFGSKEDLINDIVKDMDIDQKILLLLARPDKYDITYRYLACFTRLCEWASEFSIGEDDCIVFVKHTKEFYGRDESYTIRLYKNYYKIKDPRYIAYSKFEFELDLPELTWYLYADSLERELDITHLLEEENKMASKKKTESNEEVLKVENAPLMSEKDIILNNYAILVKEGFIPSIIGRFSKDNSVDMEIVKALKEISIKDESTIIEFGVYGIIKYITGKLTKILTPVEINTITTGIMYDFIQFTIDKYDILLFTNFDIYKGNNDSAEVMKLVLECVDFKQKIYAVNKQNLDSFISKKFPEVFKYSGKIIYPIGNIEATVDKEIHYMSIANSINNIDLLLFKSDSAKLFYMVAGIGIIDSATYDGVLNLLLGKDDDEDHPESSHVIMVKEINLYKDSFTAIYDELMSEVFAIMARKYNSIKSF